MRQVLLICDMTSSSCSIKHLIRSLAIYLPHHACLVGRIAGSKKSASIFDNTEYWRIGLDLHPIFWRIVSDRRSFFPRGSWSDRRSKKSRIGSKRIVFFPDPYFRKYVRIKYRISTFFSLKIFFENLHEKFFFILTSILGKKWSRKWSRISD